MSFGHYYWGFVTKPRRTAESLVADPHCVGLGALAMVVPAVMYTLVYVFLTIGGEAPSAFAPWLAIPRDIYYRYNMLSAAPSMFMSWILAAAVVHLLARSLSGRGSLEVTLSVMGFAVSVATWASGVHDFTDAALSALGVIHARDYEAALNAPTFWRALLRTLYSIYGLWTVVLFAKGIEAAQRLRRVLSILLALVGLVVYQGLFLLFNR